LGAPDPGDDFVTETPTSTDSPSDSDGDATRVAEAETAALAAATGSAPEDAEGQDDLLVREGDIAGDYLERLLDIIDYDGDIDMDVEGDRAVVAVVGDRLQQLVGARGVTLDALQELTRLAVVQQTGVRSRLMLDIGGYREHRRTELIGIAQDAAARARDSGAPVRLDPMNPFERKVVHDAVAAVDGVRTDSEGEEPERYVVVHPEA
jgi:spoIIIJ-associated protein